MSKHSNLNKEQPHLNLNQFESPFANSLKTKEVRELLRILTKEEVSLRDILNRGRNGKFEGCYLYGVLLIFPSEKGKSGRLWRWNVIFSPVSLTQAST